MPLPKLSKGTTVQVRLSVSIFPHGVFGGTVPVIAGDFIELTPEEFFHKHLRAQLLQLGVAVPGRIVRDEDLDPRVGPIHLSVDRLDLPRTDNEAHPRLPSGRNGES